MIGRSAGVAGKIKVSHSHFETDPKTNGWPPVKMTGREGGREGNGWAKEKRWSPSRSGPVSSPISPILPPPMALSRQAMHCDGYLNRSIRRALDLPLREGDTDRSLFVRQNDSSTVATPEAIDCARAPHPRFCLDSPLSTLGSDPVMQYYVFFGCRQLSSG